MVPPNRGPSIPRVGVSAMSGYRAEMVITTTSSTSAGDPSGHPHGPSCRGPSGHFPDRHGHPNRDRRGDRE